MARRSPGSHIADFRLNEKSPSRVFIRAIDMLRIRVNRLIDSYSGDPFPHGALHNVGMSDPLMTPGAPTAVAVNVAASIGAGPTYARENHVHSLNLGLTTKGDILVRTAAGYDRLPVSGVEGQTLTVRAAEASGLKWETPAAGGASSSRRWAFFTMGT